MTNENAYIRATMQPWLLNIKKFYYINETKWTSFTGPQFESNDWGIGIAQLWRIKKIIMGISFQGRGAKLFKIFFVVQK